jgi:hypothetical protein
MAEALNDKERLDRAVKSLRNFLRDKRQLNRLLQGNEESTNEELRQCIIEALMDWNTTPPVIGTVKLENHPNKVMLIQGAAIRAMTSAGIWHSREHMPSNDGGTSAADHAKAGEYSGWIERLTQEYERKKSDFKTQQNISAALTGMGSPSEYSMYEVYGEYW